MNVRTKTCAELSRTLFERMARDGGGFDLHRVELRYPPIAASAIKRIGLPRC